MKDKLNNGERERESIKSQTDEEVKYEEATRFEERFRELERKIVQEEDTTAAAREYTEDEPAAISEHGDGLNETTESADKRKVEAANKEHTEKCDETTVVQDKGRNEATVAAAKMKSSEEDIPKSHNNENCKSEATAAKDDGRNEATAAAAAKKKSDR